MQSPFRSFQPRVQNLPIGSVLGTKKAPFLLPTVQPCMHSRSWHSGWRLPTLQVECPNPKPDDWYLMDIKRIRW